MYNVDILYSRNWRATTNQPISTAILRFMKTLQTCVRPIVSQFGTPTYQTAKGLNYIVTKYMPKQHMTRSVNDFIQITRSARKPTLLVSLDVSLFTNVPVNVSINIIWECVYGHEEIPKPIIPALNLKKLLLVCSTESTFESHDGTLFLQVDFVSKG